MDLKSTDLYWPVISKPARHGTLRQNIHCDVTVLGAGLSGAMIARTLSSHGLDVVVLDKRDVGLGSTSASTALVLYEIDTPLIKLTALFGRTKAVKYYRRCFDSIGQLEELVRSLGGRCQFQRRASLYLASRPAHLSALKKEFTARRRAGFKAEFLTRSDIEARFSFSAPGAICSPEAGEINPLRLADRLINRASASGARIFGHTEVAKAEESKGKVVVRTADGYQVAARWLVVACGYETDALVTRGLVTLKSSYALVTQPVSAFVGWPGRCLIWETNRPYFYLRTTADNRIIIGGEDENYAGAKSRDRLIAAKSRKLMKKLTHLFPDIPARPAHCWAGTFGESKDGLPYVGILKSSSRILYALCYGANGTNFAVIASDIVRDVILQRPNPNIRLFGLDR